MTRSAAAPPLLLGWASRDTTPPRPVLLRGQFHARISNQVRDPITVTALALESGGEQCVMVSADRVNIPAPLLLGVREKLGESVPDLASDKVFISATHTHTAPSTADDEWPVLEHRVKTVELPRRKITADDVDEARREIDAYTEQLESLADRSPADPERSRCFGRRRWFSGVLERYELQQKQPHFPMELHAVRLGDVVFASNAFELYLDYGLRLKARSPALQTFVVQLAGPGTYLPSARSVSGGSYGSVPASNHVGPEGGDHLVEETLRVIGELFE